MKVYPFFEPISWVLIYTFWLTIAICFFMFLWMLKKLSVKFDFDFIIFRKNILWIFLSVFFFSRLFYVISRWNDLRHIKNPVEFFIMSDYNFSLMWAIFWFFLVFFILLRIRKEKLNNFISWLVLSFLFVLPFWYIWALLWWQVYWLPTDLWIEITYSNPNTLVPFQVPVFPLPIIYSIAFFILFSASYILSMNENNRKIIAYISLIAFSCIVFFLEFFSWKYWIFKDSLWVNMSQICSIWILLFSIYRLVKIYKED